jgi:hypothetical protein
MKLEPRGVLARGARSLFGWWRPVPQRAFVAAPADGRIEGRGSGRGWGRSLRFGELMLEMHRMRA